MYEEGGVACASLRSCAGCVSVVYCSEECQKEDWESIHKHECLMMAREYQDRVDEKLGFPQRARIQTIVLTSLWSNVSGSTFFKEIETLIMQLLCFVMPYGAQKWHILCAATVPKSKQEKSQVTFGMMHDAA
ncbi:hypothetical protein BKA70DRAFT_1290545 [Coprinopsis sp. MPI-PUGE-AT-0042]|nr:hypothetical protein BKA70DRAFT_1290188 [Coprinopsis sp. MPI-PUGE-AT-0042]KAH6906096.1 hypothetical protein BKA70DRAFT_1290545 [Coprinopsis sp. MPI-PUGE-AT-0042]